MPLYGNFNSVSFFRKMNKQLISRIICQEILYYKFSLADTEVNIYGESKLKFYYPSVLLNCFIHRQDQTTNDIDYGPDEGQLLDFIFLRDDLQQINVVPERGDIIVDRNLYWEVDNIVENQFVFGKYPEYSLSTATQNYGTSVSITVNTHHTRSTKLNITEERL
jgi:hypothetical protein